MRTSIRYIFFAILLTKVGAGYCQLSVADTIFRNKDTVWINYTERFEVDTTYNYWNKKKANKIDAILYRFKTGRNLNYILNMVKKEITLNNKSYSSDHDYEKAFICNIFFTRAYISIDETEMIVSLEGINPKKLTSIQNRLKYIFNQMIQENIPPDTFNFSMIEYELTKPVFDEKGEIVWEPIPDSLIVRYNQNQYSNDMKDYLLRDNYNELLGIFDITNLPIGRTQELMLIISKSGLVESAYVQLLNKENYTKTDNVFRHLKFPILLVNGISSPYRLKINDSDFRNPFATALRNRFNKDLQSGENVYPIFNDKDSLFLHKSISDSMYFIYTTIHGSEDDQSYMVRFPDTCSVRSMFYDFNKDGLIDFVYPKSSQLFNKTQNVIIYGGGNKTKYGLPEPQHYFDLKYSADSSVFSSFEKQWECGFRQTTLYSFKLYGDSILLQCTYYKIPTTYLDKTENVLSSQAIPVGKDKWAHVYYFVNNLDKSLIEHSYYINNLAKARKAYKKMRIMIDYYRDNPDKIPR